MLSIENRGRRGGIGAWMTKEFFVFTLSDVLKVYTGEPSTRRGRGFRQTTGDIFLSETFNPIFKMCKKVDLKQQFAKLSGMKFCKSDKRIFTMTISQKRSIKKIYTEFVLSDILTSSTCLI